MKNLIVQQSLSFFISLFLFGGVGGATLSGAADAAPVNSQPEKSTNVFAAPASGKASETARPTTSANNDTSSTTAPAETGAVSQTTTQQVFSGQALETKKRMEFLFEVSKKVNSANSGEKSKARSEIDGALDWDKIAEDAMGSADYKKQSVQNRNDFKNLLKDVITRTSYTRLDKFWDGASYQFGSIEAKNGKAHVVGKFTVKGEPFTLDYYLLNKSGKWLVYDIAFEGERYSININEQISAFLRERSFSHLMEKLRKRRNELAEEKPAAKKSE